MLAHSLKDNAITKFAIGTRHQMGEEQKKKTTTERIMNTEIKTTKQLYMPNGIQPYKKRKVSNQNATVLNPIYPSDRDWEKERERPRHVTIGKEKKK